MIMLARVVSHGGNSVRYALEKEKAKVIKVNHMPEGLDPTSIWYRMKHHCMLYQQDRTVGRKLEHFMTTFVISPSKEEAENFVMDDWMNLVDESLETLDSVGLIPMGMKKEAKTNFRNSMSVAGLHSDSKSGTLHLHLDCCRVDNDGHTNDAHDIHIRAMKAAEIINMRHGWKQPQEIREMRKQELEELCEHTLRDMQQFGMDLFFNQLRRNGYEVKLRYDKQNKLVGYTIGKNASVFKASEIGRRYMASQLEATWHKFHTAPAQVKPRPSAPVATPSTRPVRPIRPVAPSTSFTKSMVSQRQPDYTVFDISTDKENRKVEIPNTVKDIFFNEAEIPEGNKTATVENIFYVGMLLFAGYIDVAISMSESCGGGGSSASELRWHKKEDEDERAYARRCLQMAHSMCKPKSIKRGGVHR